MNKLRAVEKLSSACSSIYFTKKNSLIQTTAFLAAS